MTNRRVVPFLFEGQITVRVIDWKSQQDGWVAPDVCRALGITNASDALTGLDDDEKGIGSIYTLGGQQDISVVSESGLFALIFKSRKSTAVRFRKWITSEVIPALRHGGTYTMPAVSTTPAIILPRPWEDWSLAERRVALAEVNTANRVLSRGAGAWMWQRLGLPVPPAHLLPSWWQGELLHGKAALNNPPAN